jgi:peptidyl-prolyl cis-trans isomerase D
MFDLFRSRDKAVRILLGVILAVVAVSMVTYLIPGATSGTTGTGDDNVLARVGDDKITTQTAMQAVAMSMRQKGPNLPPEMMGYFAPQVIQSLINQRAIAYEAKRLGIRVSDDDVAEAVRQQVPATFMDKDGNIKQDVLAEALAQQNATVPQFIDDVRRGLIVSRMMQLVESGIVVTKTELEQEYKRRNEKIKIQYVLIKPAELEQQVQVTPADIEEYFKKNRQAYQTPEKKSLAIVLLDPAKMATSVTPTDAQLQAVYNSSLDRFRTPERVKIRHILIATDATTNDAQAQAKATDVLKQLKAGGDFAELAKKYSKDPGSAPKGGDLDFVTRGQMVKPFEDAAFSLKTGETSGLVKTTYGYHILQVEAREDARVKPFAEVRDTLAGEYSKTKAAEMMQQAADKVAADLKKDPTHPDKAAADVNGELVRVDNVKPGDPLPQIGVDPGLQGAISSLKQGGVSAPVSIKSLNKVAIAEVTGVVAAHPAGLDEVRPQVEAALHREKLNALVQKRADDLAAKAKANGDLAQAAAGMGLEMKVSNDFDRQGSVEGLGTASMLGDAFSAKDGTVIGPVNSADGRTVVKVLSHTPADMGPFAAQEEALRKELKDKASRERLALFEAGVRAELEKSGKVKVQQDTLNRLLQGMRG